MTGRAVVVFVAVLPTGTLAVSARKARAALDALG
jgi:hypothetical protein